MTRPLKLILLERAWTIAVLRKAPWWVLEPIERAFEREALDYADGAVGLRPDLAEWQRPAWLYHDTDAEA